MRKKVAWTYRCPICKSKAFPAGEPIDGEEVCRCTNNLCGHVMTFRASEEKTGILIAYPQQCPTCGSRSKTVTHKLFAPYSYTAYRKFMRCANPSHLSEYVVLVTFGRTLSPSAFGSFDPASGTVTLTKSLEYHAANPTHIAGTQSANACGSGLPSAKSSYPSSQGSTNSAGHNVSRDNQQPVRFRWVDLTPA